MKKNPTMTRAGRRVLYGDRPMRDVAAARDFHDIDENTMILGPLGPVASMFGLDPDTRVLYLFASPQNREKTFRGMQSGKLGYAVFARYRAGMGGPGTIDVFWANPATKTMIAAVQYFMKGRRLVVTHMAVRPRWRRNRVNWWLIDYIADQMGAVDVEFDEPTDDGKAFMRARSSR